jgi:hypothetical protein
VFRTTDIVLIAVMISAAAFTYKTKHDAEIRYSEIRRLETQIRVQEDAVNVLRADWSLLTQPSRLQRWPSATRRIWGCRPSSRNNSAGSTRSRCASSGSRTFWAGRARVSPRAMPGRRGPCDDRALFARKAKAATAEAPAIVVKGTRQRSAGDARLRIGMTMAVFFGIYAAIGGRLAYLGMQEVEAGGPPQTRVTASRPDIVDRNGEVLATDINTASLFAEPRRIVDVDEAVEKLLTVLPDLDVEMAYRRLSTQAGFVWLRRQLSPRQQQAIMDLGVPGLGFRTEKRRFYPGGRPTASHVLGLVNVDNNGIAGMEKWIDDQGLADLRALGLVDESSLQPVRLSLDLTRPAHRARRTRPGHGALRRHRRGGDRRQCAHRRGHGDGVAARLRSQQPLQRA